MASHACLGITAQSLPAVINLSPNITSILRTIHSVMLSQLNNEQGNILALRTAF